MLRRSSRRRATSATTSSSRSPAADRIFVPVEQIGRISRYSRRRAPAALEARRHRLAADEAAGPQGRRGPRRGAARAVRRPGHRRPATPSAADTPWQAEMEAAFPYEETVDQLRAVVEVKHDMEAIRPMDRLVVGDVGYGKTEVAIRAAFKATQDGKQVAVLVPTTVLAAQHHATFGAALRGRSRSRSRSCRGSSPKAEQEKAIDGPRRRLGRPRHRHAPAAVARRPVQGPRPRRRRRGAALRGRGQGAAQAAQARGRRPDPVSATPIPRTLNLALAGRPRHERHRDAAGGPAADPDAGRRGVAPASSATRSCASSTAAARSSTSTTGSRRSRPRPSSSGSCCRTRASSSATARWPRATSRA